MSILLALGRLLPEHRESLKANFARLQAEFSRLDAEFTALGSLPSGRCLLASHPAYNYLARRYGWAIVNLDLDPMEMPSAAQLEGIRAVLQEKSARHLIWESLPELAIVQRYKEELGLLSIEFSPCELRKPATGGAPQDYLAMMRENLGRLRSAFP